jgi:hypothetical protein
MELHMSKFEPAPGTQEPEATIDKPPEVKAAGTPGVDPRVAPEPVLSDEEKKIQKLDDKSSDVLAAAGASGDAEVQNLLAHRGVAVQNGDEASVKEIDKKLADLVGNPPKK